MLEGENLGLNEDGDLRVGGKRGEHIIKLEETGKVIRTVNWGKVSGAGKQKVKRGKSNAKKKK